MHPAWLLAIKSASERPSRTVLLVLAVTMSAALITAVSLGLYSVNKGIEARVARTAGSGDLRVKGIGGRETISDAVIEAVKQWPEVATVAPRLKQQVVLEVVRPVWETEKGVGPAPDPAQLGGERKFKRINSSLTAIGLTDADRTLRPLDFVSGRWPEADDEIVVDEMVVRQLGARGRIKAEVGVASIAPTTNESAAEAPGQGDFGPERAAPGVDLGELNARFKVHAGSTVYAVRQLGDSLPAVQKFASALGLSRPKVSAAPLKVVGVVRQPAMGGRAEAYFRIGALATLTDKAGRISEMDIVLRKGESAEAAAAAHKGDLGRECMLMTTEKLTNAISKNLQANRMAFTIGSMFAYVGAAFIIMTAMSTAVTERQRELAMLRCIGASRWQLAQIQLLQGGLVGGLGALLGVPVGVGMAWGLFWYYHSEIKIGLELSWMRVGMAFGGALLAGLIGAALPAALSARVAPLRALAARATLASRRGLVITTLVAVGALATHVLSSRLSDDATQAFWLYVTIGVPAILAGYFLLCVPVCLLLTQVLAQTVSRLVGLPPLLLSRTVRATPYRFGFTSGAMMAGLAVMISIWAQGRSLLVDYIGNFKFPDVFVLGQSFDKESQAALDGMGDIVSGTNMISLVAMESDAKFGVQGVDSFKTTYIGFEPDRFFDLAKLQFLEGDEATARRRLAEGGAIIVAKEFRNANHKGVGSKLTLTFEGRSAEFEIVGVVTSPGLDLISKFFQLGEEYVDQAINSVFGSRQDLKTRLLAGGEPPTQLINVALRPKVNEKAAVERILTTMVPHGAIQVGSGRRILNDMTDFVTRAMVVSSAVAVLAMVVASFGVANLIIAGIHARRFEFGVLRAVGAERSLLVKLVLGEAILVGLTASLLGVAMGLQGVLVGRHVIEMLLGIEFTALPPLWPTVLACVFVICVALLAAAPAAMGLARNGPRELLASVRG